MKTCEREQQPKRKPVGITFVVPECDGSEAGIRTLERMSKLLEVLKLEEYEQLDNKDEELAQKLRERNIPELWMHDFQDSTHPISPYKEYYVIEYEDGSKQVCLMLKDIEPNPWEELAELKNAETKNSEDAIRVMYQ